MNIFLDSSVILAACGSAEGASRYIFEIALRNNWVLQTSLYVIDEVENNVITLLPESNQQWHTLRPQLVIVPDEFAFDWITVFEASKDRPILFTAYEWADVLLTLDHGDFGLLMQTGFYNMPILKPGHFLIRERTANRLR